MENSKSNAEHFLKAAQRGNITQLSSILDEGVDINVKNHLGWNAIMMAAWNGDHVTWQWLESRGAKIQHKFKDTLEILKFEENAKSPAYCEIISQIENACQRSKNVLSQFNGAYSFEYENKAFRKEVMSILKHIWERFSEQVNECGGHVFIGTKKAVKPAIHLIPSPNQFVSLLVTNTSAYDYGNDTFDLIQKLKKIEKKWFFRIKRCYPDGITLKFLCEPNEMNGLAMALVKDFDFGMDPEAEADELESIVNSSLLSTREINLYWG